MKLCIQVRDNQTVYLNENASTKPALARLVKSDFIEVSGTRYHINEVIAVKSNPSTGVATVMGAVLGVAGSIPGIIIGGILGAILGIKSDKREEKRVSVFNRSNIKIKEVT